MNYEALALALLSMIQGLLSALNVNNGAVNSIIAGLTQLMPLLGSLSQTVLASVQNIITAVKSKGTGLTGDQLDALDAMSDEVDAAYQAIAASYLASKKKIAPTSAVTVATQQPVAQSLVSASQVSPPASTPAAE
jgi:hypothetical protein